MKRKIRESLTGLLFLLPSLAGFIVFFLYPMTITIRYTFTSGQDGSFVGFENYISIFNNPTFQLAAKNTLHFMIICVPLVLIFSFLLALMLFKRKKSFLRTASILPLVVPTAAVVLVFEILFSVGGPVNQLLQHLNISPIDWLGSDNIFIVLVAFYLWKNIGYIMILMLSGLTSIPKNILENAQIDGAGYFSTLRFIILPMMKPTFFFALLISIIRSFQTFREAYMIGGEYPPEKIYMLQHFMNNNFENVNYQHLSVAALLVFILIFIFILLIYKMRTREEVV